MKCVLSCIGVLLFLVSCESKSNDDIAETLREWIGKEIIFPELHSENNNKHKNHLDYTIVTYVDSVGCLSCKLNLRKWKAVIEEFKIIENKNIEFLFYLQTDKNEKISYMLKWDNFTQPIYFDEFNTFCNLNKLPKDDRFQTFLLEKNNKIVAIGNPAYNPKVKELYMKIISGNDKAIQQSKIPNTTVKSDIDFINYGSFNWKEEQITQLNLVNSGTNPLVINDIITSCGCLSVEYAKAPVPPGGKLVVSIKYKADKPEHFNKTLTVYCNTEESAIQFKISGNAR